MSNQLRFIVSHGGKFVYVDDEWKWKGDKTTSIVVPTSITLGGLVLRLKEKLGILDPRTKIELKFKVPNMNIPPAEICEDEDLSWYISVHKETAICVTILEFELPIVHTGKDTNFQNPSFVEADVHRNVHHDEVLESMNTGSRGKGIVRKETKEVLKPVDDRKLGKREAAVKAYKKPAKKRKAAKQDPNKLKRPPSAFFVFFEEFRKTFKKENPDVKFISAVGKAGGEKWKSMTAAEKAPYEAKAGKKKAKYGSLMDAYNKKQESSADEGGEESERSKSEVHDEDDESVQILLLIGSGFGPKSLGPEEQNVIGPT